jgi:hypothetical protein
MRNSQECTNVIFIISSFRAYWFQHVEGFETKLESKSKSKTHPPGKMRFFFIYAGRSIVCNPHPFPYSR